MFKMSCLVWYDFYLVKEDIPYFFPNIIHKNPRIFKNLSNKLIKFELNNRVGFLILVPIFYKPDSGGIP